MLVFATLVCVLCLQPATCSNILGIFPMPFRSHHAVFDVLMRGLAERGHNVTVYHMFPKPHPPPNYTDVSLTGCFNATSAAAFPTPEEVMSCEPLLHLRKMKGVFDLLISEAFQCDFFALFGHVLDVPVIMITTAVPFPWVCSSAGVPFNPSYLSVPQLTLTTYPISSLSGRIDNAMLYTMTFARYLWNCEFGFDLVPQFFPEDTPTILEAAKNVSMWFWNTHYSITQPRPTAPNVIEIGGISIEPVQKLPEDVENFINGSPRGVVYFSTGSLNNFKSFPESKRDAIVSALGRLPQRVLMKWESDDPLPGRGDNIMAARWFPQRDILANPKVKLFISHGGLIGISEAVYEGVPVLGIPLMNEHRLNLLNIVKAGAAEMMEYEDISKELISRMANKMISDRQYKENALELSRRFKDRPSTPLETAIYWTEFVIRKRGAPLLKTDDVRMSWYQSFFLDLIIGPLVLAYVLYKCIEFICCCSRRAKTEADDGRQTAVPKESDENTETSTTPKEAETSTAPEETETSTAPKKTETSTAPKKTAPSTAPKKTAKSIAPKKTAKSTPRKKTK